jgi:hypothetical protein
VVVPPVPVPASGAGAAAGGVAGSVVAGGVVLCVVVLSAFSLQAAMPNKATAETDARMSFFIISLLHKQRLLYQAVVFKMCKLLVWLRHLR